MISGDDENQINSLRFSNSGKLVCAVSNDGSVNAWVYPIQLRVISPEPVTVGVDQQVVVGEGEMLEVEDEVRSRAATSREGTPGDVEAEKQETEAEVDEERLGDGDGGVKGEGGGENDEEGERNGEDSDLNGENETEGAKQKAGDVEMTEQGSNDALMAENETDLSRGQNMPSRRPSPQPEGQHPTPTSRQNSPHTSTPVVENESRRSKQLKRFRHAVCHSASLLSLSFDPLGR